MGSRSGSRFLPCLMGALLLGCGDASAPPETPEPETRTEASASQQQAEPVPPPPRLVLLLSLDQLRRDRLSADLPGGIGRLVREGRVFDRAVLAHAYTETCPGHAVMLTGRHPGPAGIPSNSFIEKRSMKLRYCVDDPSSDAATFGGTGAGRSPRNLTATTLGDWMKARNPAARVFSVSGKDRSAIMMGGQKPDGVYWLDWRGRGAFTTSRYYIAALPDWVDRWRREKILADVPEQWEHPTGDPPNGVRADDFPGETKRFSNVSPHPLPLPVPDVSINTSEEETAPASETVVEDPTLAKLYFSPYLDLVTLRFTRELVETEGIGADDETDLLAIGLSSTDLVGHFYGPWSQESDDGLRRIDAALGQFLSFLERRVGEGRLVVVLTSDHGVMPLPESLASEGQASCPVEQGRVMPKPLVADLRSAMVAAFGEVPEPELPPASTPTSKGEAPGWLMREGHRFTVNRPLAEARGIAVETIASAAAQFLAARPGVAAVHTSADFTASSDPKAALYRNSHHPERGGDLTLELAAGCILSDSPVGTTHGSPHAYDRDVPLVFFGPGVSPGRDGASAATVDIGPTVARLIGLRAPEGLDGRVLSVGPR
jgi:predicted AlkP superfamily pyrophosphatase or phosphodiesterase